MTMIFYAEPEAPAVLPWQAASSGHRGIGCLTTPEARQAFAVFSDIDFSSYTIDQLLEDFPVLQVPYDLFEAGESPEQAAFTLKDLGINMTVCGTVSGLFLALELFAAHKSGLFKSMAPQIIRYYEWMATTCSLVFTWWDLQGTKGDSPPPTPATCGEGTVWSEEWKDCVSVEMGLPCSEFPNAVKNRRGECVPCEMGTHYDAAARGCVPGCPSGQVPNAKWGCVPSAYNKPCDYKGQKGIVTPDGNCTLDGCDPGMQWDFESETCVPSKGVAPVQNVPPLPSTTPIDERWPQSQPEEPSSSSTSAVVATLFVLAAAGTVAWLFWPKS